MLKNNAELRIRAGVALEKLDDSNRELAQICLTCPRYSVKLQPNKNGVRFLAHFCGSQFRTWIARDPNPKPYPGCHYHKTIIGPDSKRETRVLYVN